MSYGVLAMSFSYELLAMIYELDCPEVSLQLKTIKFYELPEAKV